MNYNKTIIIIYDTLTFPIAVLGYVWYFLIQTPLFAGRMKGYEHLSNIAHKAEGVAPNDS